LNQSTVRIGTLSFIKLGFELFGGYAVSTSAYLLITYSFYSFNWACNDDGYGNNRPKVISMFLARVVQAGGSLVLALPSLRCRIARDPANFGSRSSKNIKLLLRSYFLQNMKQ